MSRNSRKPGPELSTRLNEDRYYLREAVVSDARAVGGLIDGVYEELGFEIADEGEVPDWPNVLADFEAAGDAVFYVLEDRHDQRVIGMICLKRLDNQAAELGRFYLEKASRGQGLGWWLMRAVLEAAKRLGYQSIRLETHTSLAACNALYRRAGFREIPPYSGHPLRYTDIAFEKAL